MEDNPRVVLTADKGVCLVGMHKEEYIMKAEELLNQETYKIILADPKTRQKNKLISLLKNIKAEDGMKKDTYKMIYATGASIQSFMGCQRSTRQESH